MSKLLKSFRVDEEGAITLDWFVLATGVVALGAGALTLIADKAEAQVAHNPASLIQQTDT